MPQLRYLGHAAFQIFSGSTKILIDPYLSENTPHPFAIEEFFDTDLILVTHGAKDHMGDAIEIARESSAFLFCDPAVRVHALRNGVPEDRIKLMVWGWERAELGIRVKAVEARHLSFFESSGEFLSGMPLGFVIHISDNLRIYHMGDTSIFSDLKLIGELQKPNVGLVPVGALHGAFKEMDPGEAALAAQWLGLELAIPMHFDLESGDDIQFQMNLQKMCIGMQVKILKMGEVLEL